LIGLAGVLEQCEGGAGTPAMASETLAALVDGESRSSEAGA